MPNLEWTEETTFFDGARNFRAVGPGIYGVPEDAIEEYLDHRSGNWQRPSDGDGDGDGNNDNADGGDSQSDGAANEIENGDYDVLDGTISEVEDALSTGEYDAGLDALDVAEREGENRRGVHDAIADRRASVAEILETGSNPDASDTDTADAADANTGLGGEGSEE